MTDNDLRSPVEAGAPGSAMQEHAQHEERTAKSGLRPLSTASTDDAREATTRCALCGRECDPVADDDSPATFCSDCYAAHDTAGAPVIDDATNEFRALSKSSAASFFALEDSLPENPAAGAPEEATPLEALYRWVISDPRTLPPGVCAGVEQLHSLAARVSQLEATVASESLMVEQLKRTLIDVQNYAVEGQRRDEERVQSERAARLSAEQERHAGCFCVHCNPGLPPSGSVAP